MESRYASAAAVVAGTVAAATALGPWPVAVPTVGGVATGPVALGAVIAVGGALGLAAVGTRRAAAAAVGLGGIGVVLLGAYAYWRFLVGAGDALAAPLVAIVAGAAAVVAALAAWLAIPRGTAVERTVAVGVGAALGIAGFIAVVVWQLLLATVGFVVLGDGLTEMQLVFLSTLSLGLGLGTVAIGYLAASGHDWSYIDLRWPGVADLAWTVGGILALFGALIGVAQALELLGVSTPSHGIVELAVEGDPRILLLLIPASFVLIGPAEELLFRNLIQKSLYRHFSAPGAIVVTSVLFAVAHFPAYGGSPESVGPMLVIFVLSVVLGAIYRRTDNLVVPAVVHGAFNAIQFAALYVVITSDEGLLALVPV